MIRIYFGPEDRIKESEFPNQNWFNDWSKMPPTHDRYCISAFKNHLIQGMAIVWEMSIFFMILLFFRLPLSSSWVACNRIILNNRKRIRNKHMIRIRCELDDLSQADILYILQYCRTKRTKTIFVFAAYWRIWERTLCEIKKKRTLPQMLLS